MNNKYITKEIDKQINILKENNNFGILGKISFVVFSNEFNITEYNGYEIIINPEKDDLIGKNVFDFFVDDTVNTDEIFKSDVLKEIKKRICSRFYKK
jgi:hypothetical protein